MFSDAIIESVPKRLEALIIILLGWLPLIFENSISCYYIYIILLLLLFPILNLISRSLLLIYSPLLNILKSSNGVSYINKLLIFIINNSVNLHLPSYSFSLAYPTVFTLVLMRNDLSILSKILNLYSSEVTNINPFSEDLMSNKLYLICGTLNKRSCIWKYYYCDTIYNQTFTLENNKYISYWWYKALYNILSKNWYDAWLLEFYIELHNSYKFEAGFKPIETELLEQLNASIDNHLYVMKQAFKLIWDIEKDWGIDPISVLPGLQEQLPDDLDYPINQYCFLLFGGFNRLDGLFIIPDVYKQNINNSCSSKNFNHALESKIINLFILNHKNIESRLSINGHWGIFQENGLHLMTFITMPNIDNINNALTIRACADNDIKFRYNIAAMAYDSISFDDELATRQFIIKRLGESIAKWREEWKNNNSNIK